MLGSSDETITFRRLQLVGWSAYAVLWWLASLPEYELREAPLWVSAVRVALNAMLGAALSMGLHQLYRRLWARSLPLGSLVGWAVGASLVAGCLWGVAFELVKWPLEEVSFSGKPWYWLGRGYVSMAFVLMAWSTLYLGIRYQRMAQEARERALRAEALAHEAQLAMLRYQLNPHFFFNALNAIRALINEAPDRARDLVTAFADFMRYALLRDDPAHPGVEPRTTMLGAELDVMELYVDIERIRFEDRLSFTTAADPRALGVAVPPFLLHPLIENALKHGTAEGPGPLRVHVEITCEGAGVRIRVASTGSLTSPPRLRVGLRNVQARLEQYGSGRHTFTLHASEGWVEATVVLHDVLQNRPVEEVEG
ncbi:MAG: histidine kinase [Bacteroidota bacterium]